MFGSGLFGSAPVPRIRKKTRVQLIPTERKKICVVQILNPEWTQENMGQYASKEFDKAIGRARDHDATLGHKCKSNFDIEPPYWQVEETNDEIVDHV